MSLELERQVYNVEELLRTLYRRVDKLEKEVRKLKRELDDTKEVPLPEKK